MKIVATFLFVSVLVYKTNGDLSDAKYKRVRRITDGINLKRHWLNKYYFPIFMIRRSVFAIIPVLFIGQ